MEKEKNSYFLTHVINNHDMSCHDSICHDNTHTNNHDMSEVSEDSGRLSKTDWWYLVNTLESWRVFNPRAVVKKNPQLAWRVMNLCKDPSIRVKGAYFTTCFNRELAKTQNQDKLEYWRAVARQKLGIA